MNTHDIELPPLPVGTTSPMIYGAYYCASNMQDYARTAIVADRQRGTAKQRYAAAMNGCNETDPIERLRFYCSLAMSGQDWIDVEPFFDAVIADRKRMGEPVVIQQEVIETLEMILAADWRKWEELASPDEFVRWAKSRANYALSIINEAPQPAEPSAGAMTTTGKASVEI